MIFRQLIDKDTNTYTYLVGCEQSREAFIVDPVKSHCEHYLQLIEELQLTLKYALDTHYHADHITALGLLREQTQCQTVMGTETAAEGLDIQIKERQSLSIGTLSITALYTPGHTDDSYCYLMSDRIFTGDTLFIRGTGRTDFQNGCASQQFDSLFKQILTLPDHLLVYPGHDYKGWTVSTIGEEKKYNPRLQVEDKSAYVRLMDSLNLAYPKHYDTAVPANKNCGM